MIHSFCLKTAKKILFASTLSAVFFSTSFFIPSVLIDADGSRFKEGLAKPFTELLASGGTRAFDHCDSALTWIGCPERISRNNDVSHLGPHKGSTPDNLKGLKEIISSSSDARLLFSFSAFTGRAPPPFA